MPERLAAADEMARLGSVTGNVRKASICPLLAAAGEGERGDRRGAHLGRIMRFRWARPR